MLNSRTVDRRGVFRYILKLSTFRLFLSQAALSPLREFHRFADSLTNLLDPYLPGKFRIVYTKLGYIHVCTPMHTYLVQTLIDMHSGNCEDEWRSQPFVFIIIREAYAA